MIRRAAFFAFLLICSASRAEITPGEILMSEMNCAACHEAGPLTARLASRQSPRVGRDGVRVAAGWLRAFLAAPRATEPGTLMPDVLHALPAEQKAAAADALTHYLISLQPQEPPRAVIGGDAALGERLYHTIGCAMCHAPFSLPPGQHDPAAKEELARLAQTAVPLGQGIGEKYSAGELARFLREPLRARPSGRMPGMNLTDSEANAIAAYLLVQSAPAPREREVFTVDPAKAARGQQLFAEMNCAACHEGADAPKGAAKPLARLAARQPRGCLSTRPGANVPKFDLTDRQRQVILALLQEQTPLNLPLDAGHAIRRTMTTLNCYACHARDRRGGVSGLRRGWLTSLGEGDPGDEGRVPPPLNAVGAKLRPEWTRQLLAEGTKVRPFMATRMPCFGTANAGHLAELFEQADARPGAAAAPSLPATADAGRQLIGAGGLACVKCHAFAGSRALETPGIDLAASAQRLKWDWFRHFLLDPQAVRPGTKMPALHGADAEQQIAAIWAALAR